MRAPAWSLILSLVLLCPPAAASDAEMYARALFIIKEQYLRLDEMDSAEALFLAAEAAEDAVPWLIVTRDRDEIVLTHGERGEFARVLVTVRDIDDLQGGLERLERAVRSAPEPIPDDVDLAVELLRGVSRTLDRHSVVMYRDRLTRFNERIKGKLDGIGSSIKVEDGVPTISEVFPDSPAERGGLLKGDVVTHIDGFSTTGLSIDQVVSRIRGEKGSEVVLTILRGAQAMALPLIRAEVRVPNVSWSYSDGGIGTMAISSFSEQTSHFMHKALADFRAAGPLNGIIIDLRGNTGGSMRQACYSVDQFLSSGTVLRTEGRGGAEVRGLMRRYPARIDGDEPDVPIIVLVNNRSASASEILAGSLLLSDRAVLIGERTHGKGTVQRRETLRSDGASDRVEMKLTVAEYKLTDARVPIEMGVGLEPDLWVLPVAFTRGGAAVPDAGADKRTRPELRYVDERPGWREGVTLSDEDTLVSLAEEILLAVPSGAWGRQDVLAAMDLVLPGVRADFDAQVRETFGYRGLDWSEAAADAQLSTLDVQISIVDPPVAGQSVEVRAQVENRGAVPVHQVRVQLSADSRLPWDGLTLPVGKLAPGERALGSAMVWLPAGSPSRIDAVVPTVYADRAEAVALAPVSMAIDGRPALPLSATARVRPVEDGTHTLQVDLKNPSGEALEDVRARLALQEGTAIELLESEVSVGALAAGGVAQASIPMLLPAAGLDEELELRVDASGWGRVLTVPIDLVEVDEVTVSPPQVRAALPTEAPTGPLDVTVRATDDSRVASLTAWWDNEKIAWSDGGAGQDELLLSLDIGPQHHVLTLRVTDDQGAERYESYHVQGIEDRSSTDAQEVPADRR